MRESLESWPTGVGVGVGVGVAVDVGVGVGVGVAGVGVGVGVGMAGVGVGVGVGGVGVGVGVSVGVGVGVGPGWIDETAAQGENSEVLLKGSVAVALTLPRPCGPAPRLNTTENEASPLPLVVMLVDPEAGIKENTVPSNAVPADLIWRPGVDEDAVPAVEGDHVAVAAVQAAYRVEGREGDVYPMSAVPHRAKTVRCSADEVASQERPVGPRFHTICGEAVNHERSYDCGICEDLQTIRPRPGVGPSQFNDRGSRVARLSSAVYRDAAS